MQLKESGKICLMQIEKARDTKRETEIKQNQGHLDQKYQLISFTMN